MTRLASVVTVLAFVLAVAPVARAESPRDILVVVNRASTVDSVTIDELRDVFLKKRASWRSGGKTTPVNASEGSSLREDFRKRVLNMSSSAEKSYWQKRKIKAGESRPAEFENTLRAVFKLRGAVSYVYRSQFKEGTARVVLVLPAG